MTDDILAKAMHRDAAATRRAMVRAGMADRTHTPKSAAPKPRTDAAVAAERLFRDGLSREDVMARTGISRAHAYRIAAAVRAEA